MREGAQLCDHQSPFPWCPVALLEPSHPSLILPNLLHQISSLAALMAAEWGREPNPDLVVGDSSPRCQGDHPQHPKTKRGFKKVRHTALQKRGLKMKHLCSESLQAPDRCDPTSLSLVLQIKTPSLSSLPTRINEYLGWLSDKQAKAVNLFQHCHLSWEDYSHHSPSLPSLDYALTQHINLSKYNNNNNNRRREKKKAGQLPEIN